MNRRPIIAIDFDGTIVEHRYPEVGDALPDAVETIRWLHTWADVIIWTCRYVPDDLAHMGAWLREHGVPFFAINQNGPGLDFCPRPKIYFDIVIDDRNIGGLPPWLEIRKELEKVKEAWG